ncbi:MAG: dihydrolipoyllysine-residue acetyltransferase [Candidatus Eremiobacteraeota bacterium]|nr:dihydrolipoyllysine-residue acetyltransferase [Candidatus Eremiobacteraeota bacterium]
MSELIEIKVPDIGDFKEIPVIDILVKLGESIRKEDPLVTLESDKAAMEVPSPQSGIVKDITLKVGDKVSQGSAILTLEVESSASPTPAGQSDPGKPVDASNSSASASKKRLDASHAKSNDAVSKANLPAQTEASGEESTVELRVPDIGDFENIPVVDVFIKPGDRIDKESPLVSLESDKATMEVPADAAGTIVEVAVKLGDKISKGSLIATLRTIGTPVEAAANRSEAQAPPSGSTEPLSPAPEEHTPQSQPSTHLQITPTAGNNSGTVHASPSIRRFSRELGVELHNVRGSGPSGRITREDVQNHVKSALQSGTGASGSALGLAPWPKIDFAQFGEIDRRPLSRIQKLSGPNLHRNWVMIPHVTNNDDADITELEAFRKQLNAEAKQGTKVTILAFLIKAVVSTLQKFPDFNSSLDGDSLILKKYYNIGFAADTPNGLMVPVIKAADSKGVMEIASETSALAAKARDGKLGLAEMQGGTFTISSLGGIGGTYFTPIINAPEVAILGVCRSTIRPIWNGTEFTPHLMLPLSLSYDHRVIDGASAARFNVYLAALLADLRRAML